MGDTITILAEIKLAKGISEADLLAGSEKFQKQFAGKQPGLIRRELVRKADGNYLDIVQFASMAHAEALMEKEKTSAVCHEFFALMDMGDGSGDDMDGVEICHSLETYQ
ncbi:hypothetical protein MNBD_ALPHA11-634 [hydrothermal vent metagenome]|uniref:ABM domain-containing protein n=1 Tax=hydrothermal vent metagenome TaxID=652676 RepID=A0A3B0TWD0_9ZZZZ